MPTYWGGWGTPCLLMGGDTHCLLTGLGGAHPAFSWWGHTLPTHWGGWGTPCLFMVGTHIAYSLGWVGHTPTFSWWGGHICTAYLLGGGTPYLLIGRRAHCLFNMVVGAHPTFLLGRRSTPRPGRGGVCNVYFTIIYFRKNSPHTFIMQQHLLTFSSIYSTIKKLQYYLNWRMKQ